MQRIDAVTGELLSSPSLAYQLWANDYSRLPEQSRRYPRASSPGIGSDAPKHPSSNTGCLVTQDDLPQPARGVLIDWLSVSFQLVDGLDDPLDRAFRLFGGDYDWAVQDRGGYGYECSARRGHVSIYWGGTAMRGTVYAVASGQGCRQLEAEGLVGQVDAPDRWRSFLGQIGEWGAVVRRLDVAIDDTAALLDIPTMRAAVMGKHVARRSHKWEFVESDSGSTLYLGRRSSDSFVRVYDKRAETLVKHKVADPSALPDHWVRCELELRGRMAESAAAAYLVRGVEALVEALRGVCDFTDPEAASDTRRSRRPLASWWAEFVRGVDRVRLWCAPRIPTMESTFRALERQYGATLAILVAMPRGVERLAGIIQEGGQKIGRRHLSMLHALVPRPPGTVVAV